jgi:hypothetical protein
MSIRGTQLRSHVSLGLPLMLSIGGIAVIFALTLAYNYGRGLQQESDSTDTIAIENEDAAFCGTIGIAQNSYLYTRCRSGLADIRRSHQQRLTSTAIGMF